jgi:hypothetical protein
VNFCVLEALQNVQRYACASNVIVRLRGDAGALTFDMEDDGQGFDPATVTKGAGLLNVSDRAPSTPAKDSACAPLRRWYWPSEIENWRHCSEIESAGKGNRTLTPLRAQRPERCVSTSSTTPASDGGHRS